MSDRGKILGVIRALGSDIKLAHSVFALPFAVLGGFMAASPEGAALDWRRFGGQLGLIVLAMVCARTVAMLANRWLDRDIDAGNPRTAGRALPSARVTSREVVVAIALASLGFVLVCAGFGVFFDNWWPLGLSLPVLAWISAYGLFKRYTSLCHLYLGTALGLSPLAAAIAIDPSAVHEQPALWLLATMVVTWVAGFDIIYALQDVETDRRQALYSMPSRLGIRSAMIVSRTLHVIAAACLIGAGVIDPRLSLLYAIGVTVVIAMLVYEHLTVSKWGTTRVALAFFTLNGIISCVLGTLGAIDIVIR